MMVSMGDSILFDPNRARGGDDKPDVGVDATVEFVGGTASAPMTVSVLLGQVKTALADYLPRRVVVVGEISNFNRHGSGHLYFSLKDPAGQIAAVMFRSAAAKVKFDPTDGLEVVAAGRVDVYEAQGKLQLYVTSLTPRGAGALELAFRQLVDKLRGEGLFDPAHKRALPAYPRTLCVVTSPTGAAIRDIRRTLSRRWPTANVYLLATRVQGDGAAEEIARAIRLADGSADRLGLELLIVARGGGNIEDLWCFNEEIVARALADCRIPVVSGVGHEVDTTIADMVADARAATPTAAAELATPDRRELHRLLRQLAMRLSRNATEQVARGGAALKLAERSEFFRNPLHRVQTLSQHLDEAGARLRAALTERHGRARTAVQNLQAALRWRLGALARTKGDALAARTARLAGANPIQRIRLGRGALDGRQWRLAAAARVLLTAGKAKIDRCRRTLEAMGHSSVLARGYSITRDRRSQVIRQSADVTAGQIIRTELADGEIRSVVDGAPARKRTSRRKGEQGPTLF